MNTMGSASPKHRNNAVQKVKARLPGFSVETLESIAKLPSDWKIPEKATTVPSETTQQDETRKFTLCFDYLNLDVCVYAQFDPTKARALIRLFKRVNDCEIRRLGAEGIVRDTITNTAPYESLFTNLSPDIEMKEAELPDGGRVFFFIAEHRFNIVSIESAHRNI